MAYIASVPGRRAASSSCPTTLEYLYKGGRIGRASSLAGGPSQHQAGADASTRASVDVYKKVRGVTQGPGGHARRTCWSARSRAARSTSASSHADAPRPVPRNCAALLEATDRDIDIRLTSIRSAPVIGTYVGPGRRRPRASSRNERGGTRRHLHFPFGCRPLPRDPDRLGLPPTSKRALDPARLDRPARDAAGVGKAHRPPAARPGPRRPSATCCCTCPSATSRRRAWRRWPAPRRGGGHPAGAGAVVRRAGDRAGAG